MLYRLHIRTTFQRREYLNLPNCFRQGITILKRFKNQCPTKTSAIPASPLIELGPTTEDDPGGKWPCREAVGSLPWLAIMARPNMANAVRVVARHSHNPGEERWNAVLKILSYLRCTTGRGVTFTRAQRLLIGVSVYVGADFAEKDNDRRAVSGAVVMCGGFCVCWKSTTQRCVTSSTTEAEYVACGDGIRRHCSCVRFGAPAAVSCEASQSLYSKTTKGLNLWPKTRLARPTVSILKCVITLWGVW